MSERGSLVTEFIYCPDCISKVMVALSNSEDFEMQTLIANHIIAAKIHAQWPGGEFIALQNCFDENNVPCHNIRFAVFSDSEGSALLELFPDSHWEDIKPVLCPP